MLCYSHGKSGSVTLPRVMIVLAGLTVLEIPVRPRRAERAVGERKMVVDIVDTPSGCFHGVYTKICLLNQLMGVIQR